ncbi:hypothetical protein [Marinobacter shengliensis]|jgi:hypothetical protein|uniref:MafI family immunity protein n=1 Tax=Marinobacter shengliensis TaxID=1389223 RepID=A0ABV4W7S7_9GAMM
MSIVLKADMISRALFEFDPMNTCCKENDCFDEYDRIAESVEGRLRQGFTLKEALVLELAESFFDAETLHTRCLDPVVAYLEGRKH